MKKVKRTPKRLPKFRTPEEEIRFIETHDMAALWNEFGSVDELIELSPSLARRIRERTKKRLLAIRLEEWQIARARQIARRKGVPYQKLMREWISRGIREENRSSKRRAE